MFKFEWTGKLDRATQDYIQDGYEKAARILMSNEFLEKLREVKEFTYTKDSPLTVKTNFMIAVEWFKKNDLVISDYWYKNSNVIGMTDATKKIYINRNGAGYRGASVYGENFSHEFGHNPLGYGHGSNFPAGSWRGRMLGDWADKNKAVPQTLERIMSELWNQKN